MLIIRRIRENRGWTQERLAEELGVDQATVSRLERGVGSPSRPVQKLLERLAAEPVQNTPEAAA